MLLHQTISKAFCINLYHRPDRWAKASKQFAREGLNVERFNAIEGAQFKKQYELKPGNCGCNLSHYLIIEQSMLMGFDAILIFEDDAVLAPGFVAKIDRCLQDLPDGWEMLMLGASHRTKPTAVTEHIYRVNQAFCSHAYIIHSRIFPSATEELLKFRQPFDCFFTELQQRGNVYVTNPTLAWQEEGFSDIEGRVMNYDFIKAN